jgi:hypothetical protein
MVHNFKRDNELVEKVEQYIRLANPNDNDTELLKSLIEKYEDATFANWIDADEFVADSISDFTNSFNFPDDLVAKKMANGHCTLQQSFMRLCMKFIKIMSEKKYWDARNEASVTTAQKIMEAFGGKPIGLPCI